LRLMSLPANASGVAASAEIVKLRLLATGG